MGYRHQREDMLAAAIEVAHSDGLAALTFGRVAKQVGTNDRTVVYYFPTKGDLIAAVVTALSADLQQMLTRAFGDEPLQPAALVARAWPVFAETDNDPIASLFFQVIGMAAAGTAPYVALAPMLLDQWAQWLEPLLDVPPRRRRQEALAIMARIDGLLLLRLTLSPEAAAAAARVLLEG